MRGGEAKTHTGRCLCGAVHVAADFDAAAVHACHCASCRRWGGGPAFAADLESAPRWEGAEHIATFRSSDWAERAFCRICGAGLYVRILETGAISLNTGILDDQTPLRLASQIFIDEKPEYYALSNPTPVLTGAEVYALHAPTEAHEP